MSTGCGGTSTLTSSGQPLASPTGPVPSRVSFMTVFIERSILPLECTAGILPHKGQKVSFAELAPDKIPTPSFRVANTSRLRFHARLREGTREVSLERVMAG